MNGILNLYKPGGWTSHDAVARLRRLTGQRRIGHAGTLDPAATGVLVVCLGHATRLLEYLAEHDKWYLADVVLGVTTDTDDAEGRILAQRPVETTPEAVEAALATFVGEITQRPPAYSAIKQGGQPLYKLARAGQAVDPPERRVRVYEIVDLTPQPHPQAGTRGHGEGECSAGGAPMTSPPLGGEGDGGRGFLRLLIHCGKGTYIRSIARDLGERLGCGAYLHDLVRLRSGPFGLADSVRLNEVELAVAGGWLEELLHAPDAAILDRPAAILDGDAARRLTRGLGIPLEAPAHAGSPCRLYTAAGRFLGVGRLAGTQLRPEKILAAEVVAEAD